jgi:membrane protease YdiL (CAAX protease family)
MFEVAGAPEKDSFPFWSYEDLALLIAAILPSLLIGSLLTRFSGASNKGLQTLLFQSTFFALLLTALYLLVSLRYRRPFWRSMGWSWPVRGAWWCLAAGPVLAFFIPALGVALRAPEVPDPIKDLITGRGSLAIVMLFVVVLGPIYEELFFRGFLYPLLAKSFGAPAGILLSALPFALLHGAQYAWAWQQIALVGLAGVAFGFARRRTGSTAASTILHSCYNGTQFVLFLALRG